MWYFFEKCFMRKNKNRDKLKNYSPKFHCNILEIEEKEKINKLSRKTNYNLKLFPPPEE